MFVVFARRRAGCPFDRFFTVIWLSVRTAAREEAATCCRSDALLKPARAQHSTLFEPNPREKCVIAPARISLCISMSPI